MMGPLATEGFMPHGHCYLWLPELVGLHVVSDALIALAYIAIPFTLVYVVRKRGDVPFDWMIMCFGVFIVSCGLTHVLEIVTLWHPVYWLSGAVKAVTALASLSTAGLLIRLAPQVLRLPSPSDLREATSALETSEARFRAAAEGSRDAFYILEAIRDVRHEPCDFSFVYANSYARARMGDLGDPIGKRLSEIGGDIPIGDFVERCKRVMQGGQPVDEEMALPTHDGATRYLHLQIVPHGTGVAVTSRDITQRKHDQLAIQRAETLFRSLLESAPDSLVIVDERGLIVFVNAQTQDLLGYDRNALLGQHVEILLPERVRATHVERRTAYAQDPLVRGMGGGLDLYARRRDGREVPVEIRLSPLATDRGTLISATIRDVTARRVMENALKLANQELEAFSYSVAHDLRAPLRGMSGFAEILMEDHGRVLDAEGLDCLTEIRSNAERMGHLIDALLSLSHVARSALRPEAVDLGHIARAVAADLARAEPERRVEVVVQQDLTVTMDPALARTLLTNLIGNAWKFSAQAANARIEVGTTTREGQPAFFVRDNGAGFDMAFANKLFAPFQRLHTVHEFAGTGIGLATVQRIVHRHGGQVWAEGRVDAGATFSFSLPAGSLEVAA
jgi:PAS domain S-box-containing protein